MDMDIPLQTCYQIYVFLINIATVLIAYYVCKKMSQNVNISLIGSFLYLMSAPRLVNLYTRSAVGEYTATTFFPLILYGLYLVYSEKKEDTNKGWLPLALGMSAVVMSHVISFEISLIVVGGICVLNLKKTLSLVS